MTLKHLFFYSTLLAISPNLLWGSENETSIDSLDLCPTSSYADFNYSSPPTFTGDALESTEINAIQVQNKNKNITSFSGNVLIERNLIRLQADKVDHNKANNLLTLHGNVHIDTLNMALNTNDGWLNIKTNEGEFENSLFFLPETKLTGKSTLFSFSTDKATILKNTQFSTCPTSQRDWHLGTSSLALDQHAKTGTAKHAVFWIGKVPVFYFPWIQFPLGDERRSGILTPGVGTSSTNGLALSIPWYWNIAPNQDALITASTLRNRGEIIATDYRYLTQNSHGNLKFDYINKDKLFLNEDGVLGDSRYLAHFDNSSRLSDRLNLSILVNDASDERYLNDLSSSISLGNTTHLERNAKLNYIGNIWNIGLMTQAFQTIDPNITLNNRPYQRLPQLTIKGRDEIIEIDNGILLGSLDSEWVSFKHENDTGLNARAQGSRLHIYPKLSLPMEGSAWFLKPSAGFMYTQYNLENNGISLNNQTDRGLSVLSLDSGLFFEKHFDDSPLIQTLEPRLFYLNIPFEEQLNPLFDTSRLDFSFASLFRENRFSGIDRVGDANQLTLALSSRLLNKNNGSELFSMSIGRIYYFDPQKVLLNPPNPPITLNSANSSDIIAEIGGHFNRWSGRATYQLNTDTNKTEKRNIQFSYTASDKAVFNVGYRFKRNAANETQNTEQTDISFAWPFARNYSLLGRKNYDITFERDIETLVGIEYKSCCWAIRLLSQRYRRLNIANDNQDPYRTSIMLQFVLKGFGSTSDKEATNTLKQAILGYQPDF